MNERKLMIHPDNRSREWWNTKLNKLNIFTIIPKTKHAKPRITEMASHVPKPFRRGVNLFRHAPKQFIRS